MMLRKSILVGAIIAAAASLAIIGGTAQAHPATMKGNAKNTSANAPAHLPCTQAVPSIGVLVCFQAAGDKFWIYDTASDGHHVAVGFQVEDLHVGECHDYHGVAGGWTVCDQFSGFINERLDVGFTAYVMEGDKVLKRSPERNAFTS